MVLQKVLPWSSREKQGRCCSHIHFLYLQLSLHQIPVPCCSHNTVIPTAAGKELPPQNQPKLFIYNYCYTVLFCSINILFQVKTQNQTCIFSGEYVYGQDSSAIHIWALDSTLLWSIPVGYGVTFFVKLFFITVLQSVLVMKNGNSLYYSVLIKGSLLFTPTNS